VATRDREILEQPHDAQAATHAAEIGEEFRIGFEVVDAVREPAVTVFGSARIREGHRSYAQARVLGRLFAEAGFAVVTGGGGGVMEAANRGCKEHGGQSVGFNIVPRTSRTRTRTSTSSTPSITSTRARSCW
jgi:predicted Rossmann-fold nucleotide-binding protein